MVSYKLSLKSGDAIEIAFHTEDSCSLSIDGGATYAFSIRGGKLNMSMEVNSDVLQHNIFLPDIVSIQQLDYNEGEFMSTKIEKNSPHALRHNCCTLNGKEYCIYKGCVKAPCGTICA